MSASTIIDTAPLARLFATPTAAPNRPRASQKAGSLGTLQRRRPPCEEGTARAYPTWTAPASFTLHEGNFSSDGVILVTIMRSHSADSLLIFEVAEGRSPGRSGCFWTLAATWNCCTWLESVGAAELWIAKEGYRNARLEMVGEDISERAGKANIAA